MNETPLTIEQLFQKFGKANATPKIGQAVLVERGGKTDEAAFALGEITNVYVGGVRRESRVVVKEKYVYFADGSVTVPHRTPVTLPFQHFAKSIQERLNERAARLAAVAHQYQQWADLRVDANKG